jgi:transcriptional regulator GlxA family with amidase domain
MEQATGVLVRSSTGGYVHEGPPRGHRPATAPAGQFLLRSPLAAEDATVRGPDNGAQPTRSVDLVLKLLERAAEAVDSDRAAAKDCIARASSLLRTDHRANGDCRDATTSSARGGLAAWQVRRLTEHIDAALASTIRMHDCASIARLSTSHFRRAFKVSFGVTFSGYLSRRRVERAQEIMMTTDQPLCHVARRCGFADQAHFSRVFRRFVGASPAVWRRL